MSSLPYDLQLELLFRLPVKSLVRFQGVCKQWRSLISDPKFAILQQEKQAEINNHPRILMSIPFRFQSFDSLTTSFRDLDFPYKRRFNGMYLIIGSCNGLVCIGLYQYKNFFLWNPSTGVCKKIPDPNLPYQPSYLYGFGHDPSTDDYKVVLGTCWRNPNLVRVFSMKTNSWRTIRSNLGVEIYMQSTYVSASRGRLVNGALHWLTRGFSFGLAGPVIIAFDLAKEKFHRFDKVCDSRANSLGVVGGCLSLNIDGFKTAFELWVMKEYGVASSWERLTKVEDYQVVDYKGAFFTLCATTGGEIIMINSDNELVICNPKERTIRTIYHQKNDYLCETVPYTESLVSPNYKRS